MLKFLRANDQRRCPKDDDIKTTINHDHVRYTRFVRSITVTSTALWNCGSQVPSWWRPVATSGEGNLKCVSATNKSKTMFHVMLASLALGCLSSSSYRPTLEGANKRIKVTCVKCAYDTNCCIWKKNSFLLYFLDIKV